MKKLTLTIFMMLILASGFSQVLAQDNESQNTDRTQKFQAAQRPNLLRELNLSKEQVQQLRQIMRDKQPLVQQAQRRLRIVQKTLDETIYSDQADESLIQEKVRELETAQSQFIRAKADMEFSIRKILTAEQLVKFRELRQNFQSLRPQNRGNVERPVQQRFKGRN